MKKRILAITLIFTLLISCFTYIKPKMVYAADGTTIMGAKEYLEAFIMASMGIVLTTTNLPVLMDQAEKSQEIFNFLASGVESGVWVVTDAVKLAWTTTMDSIKSNPLISKTGADVLTDGLAAGTIPAGFTDALSLNMPYTSYVLLMQEDNYNYKYNYKIINSNAITISGQIVSATTGYTMYSRWRYKNGTELSDWVQDGDASGSRTLNATEIYMSNMNLPTIDLNNDFAGYNPNTTIFPVSDDVVTELNLPTTFPTNLTLEDVAGKTTEEFPIDVGVESYPYTGDDDVDPTAFPWYYPLTKWFKKVSTKVGEIGDSITGALTSAKDSIITAIQEGTRIDTGTDESGNKHDWPELPQLLNLLIMILILIIRLVIACLGMVLRLGQIAPTDTYLNEDFKQGLNYLKNQECLPDLTYFNMIIGIATIIQVCALVKFVRRKISMQVE